MSRHNELEVDVLGDSGFEVRRRNSNLVKALFFYFISVLVLFSIYYIFPVFSPFATFIIAAAALVAPAFYFAYSLRRNLDIVTGVEFQNALFSSAISKNNDFLFFADRQGNIVFTDNRLDKVLPNFSRDNAFDAIADVADMSHADRAKMLDAVDQQKREHFLFNIARSNGNKVPIRLSLEPLSRPKGYFVIYGRVFVAKRQDVENVAVHDGKVESASSLADSSQLAMDALPFGVYSLSSAGHICSVNKVLKEWLGYSDGDIVGNHLKISDLIYTADGMEPVDVLSAEGKVSLKLKQKNASLLHVEIEQYHTASAQGLITGIVKKKEG